MPIKYINRNTGHVTTMATPAEAAARTNTHRKRTKRQQQQIIDRMDDSRRWQRVTPEYEPAPRTGAPAQTDDQVKERLRTDRSRSEEAKAAPATRPVSAPADLVEPDDGAPTEEPKDETPAKGESADEAKATSKPKTTTRRRTTTAKTDASTEGPAFTRMSTGSDDDQE